MSYSKNYLVTWITLLLPLMLQAQYAPQVPLAGNEAISLDDAAIVDWASGCVVYKGWLDIADKALGQPTAGQEANAIGPANGAIVSLGDSGVAVLTFAHSIRNGAGPDFAVFENGFANLMNDTMAFLELAFVEVSSDGENFARFPARSSMQDTAQIDNFSFADARYYHNLAGKYLSGYGTPFDLEELAQVPGLDVNSITHVRIVDVVGSIVRGVGSADSEGRMINDPYPSPVPSAGFDLNAIAVLNSNKPLSIASGAPQELSIYPNPAKNEIQISRAGHDRIDYSLHDVAGRSMLHGRLDGTTRIHIGQVPAGLYLLRLQSSTSSAVFKLMKQD